MQIGDRLRKGLRLLGGMLIGEKLATEDQVAAALAEQKQRKGRGWPHKRLGEILVEMSVVSRKDVDRVLAEQQKQRAARPEPPPAQWKFVASKNAHVFHAPGCKSVTRISAANALHFRDREQAQASGRRPCAKCC